MGRMMGDCRGAAPPWRQHVVGVLRRITCPPDRSPLGLLSTQHGFLWNGGDADLRRNIPTGVALPQRRGVPTVSPPFSLLPILIGDVQYPRGYAQ
jgi:hypothetical protein